MPTISPRASRNPDGSITVLVGDGSLKIGPGHPWFAEYDTWIKLAARAKADLATPHHVPGQPMHWKHGYIPLDAETAARNKKGKAIVDKLAGGKTPTAGRRKAQTLYHVSNSRNRESIAEKGLVPPRQHVWFYTELAHAQAHVQQLSGSRSMDGTPVTHDIYKVDMTGYRTAADHHIVGATSTPGRTVRAAIPPERLSRLPNTPTASPHGKKLPDLLKEIREQGGFTYDPTTNKMIRPREPGASGFAIAIPHTEHVVGDGSMNQHDFEQAILKIVRDNPEVFRSGAKIGGWYSPTRQQHIVEFSEIHHISRAQAIKLGQDRNQEAILDFKTGEEINTGGTGG